MSADFIIADDTDEGDKGEFWISSGGIHDWLIEFLADNVRDEELVVDLRKYLRGGYRYFALNFYGIPQIREIVRVIRELLMAAVEEEFPPPDVYGVRDLMRELVEKVTRWSNAKPWWTS